jgi:hypothetical protein
MNFDAFHSMTVNEAREYLAGFLATERGAISIIEPAAHGAGVEMNYTLQSLPSVLKWILSGVTVFRVPVPETEPKWIRDYHKDGLVEFAEPSKYLILRGAYYLGECFVRYHPARSWSIGDSEYMEKNMPVVAGFRSRMELPPILVCESIFSRILGTNAPESHIDVMVNSWIAVLP